MTPDEYERIKETEKEHLRAMKKLKERLRQAERQNTVNKALNEIANAPGEDLLKTHEEMVDKLAMEAIHQEARLEIALSSQREQEESATEKVSDSEGNDEELQKIRAKELIRQMKIQMGLEHLKRKQEVDPDVRENTQSVDSPESEESTKPDGSSSANSLPDKTIGRMSED